MKKKQLLMTAVLVILVIILIFSQRFFNNNFKQRCLKNTLSHAHLIAGEDGVGKGKLANILAKFILNGYLDREYVDIINYSSEKSSFGVDDVRDIIEEVYKKPFEKDKKVIIIHEGNKLTIQAQNALLKTIEEPPKGVYIIILCESLELILDTIKSRCEIYKLKPLTKSELYEYIKIKKFNYDENLLLEINFVNARQTEDTNLNKYLNKKKSKGKIDLVMSIVDALYLLQEDILLSEDDGFTIQVI